MSDHMDETGGMASGAGAGSASAGDALTRLSASVDAGCRGPAPVDKWNPPFCGDIDMRIAQDGTWFYMGTPIGRAALVKLFASVLRRDPERYVLVTPVERVGIAVEDVPFMAVEMAVEGEGPDRRIAFRTNVDDLVQAGPGHPMRFETDEDGAIKPYLHVRGDLWARVTRALTYDLVEMLEPRQIEGADVLGLAVAGEFFTAGANPAQADAAVTPAP